MMKKTIFSTSGFLACFAILALSSCTQNAMDDVNKNNNNPKTVPSKFIVTDILTRTAENVVGGDISLYASMYMEHEVGDGGQFFDAEQRSSAPALSNTYNNAWIDVYTNVKNAKLAITACSTPGNPDYGNDITLGISKVMLAYNLAIITDAFGDAPCDQAGLVNDDMTPKYMQPTVDKQQAIYTEIMNNLDSAIVLFDSKDAILNISSADLIYNGDASQWKKAAYGLKARYTMRLLLKSADQTADLNNILTYINNSFTSVDDEMKFAAYNGASAVNPFFSFNDSRYGYYAASQSYVTKLTDRNDPRAVSFFNTDDHIWALITDPSAIVAAPNGDPVQDNVNKGIYSGSMAWFASDVPTMLLSYHELLFLKAEALCRLGRSTEAKPIVNTAIEYAFENLARTINSTNKSDWGQSAMFPDDPAYSDATLWLNASTADTYFTNTVSALFDANPLQETMIQKYMAFWGASGESFEAYNDYRRLKALGENFITLNNKNPFPLRYTYGSDEITANDNVAALYTDQGQYVYKENVWWAGGNR